MLWKGCRARFDIREPMMINVIEEKYFIWIWSRAVKKNRILNIRRI